MNNIQIFKNKEFGEVRTLLVKGEPWFVAKDIANKLGYAQTSNMMKRIDGEDFMSSKLDGMNMKSLLINESGFYSAIIGSKLDSAKRFKRWVTSEVLPSLRKSGGYIVNQENMTPVQIMAAGLEAAKKIIENKNKEIDRMRPKEVFADAVSASQSSILIGELAKLLRQNGVETGQKRLFDWMRENGFLIKSGSSKNMPTQKAMEMGLFEIKEGSYINGSGANITTKTTKVTGKGQQYFINKFLAP